MNTITRFTGIAVLGAVALATAPAFAQNSQQSQMPSAAPKAESISESELEDFAEARADVLEVQQSYQGKMQQAQDPSAQAEMRQQANQEMAAAVEDSGLSINEFNQINRAAQSNPQIAQKIQQMQ